MTLVVWTKNMQRARVWRGPGIRQVVRSRALLRKRPSRKSLTARSEMLAIV